ncbi:MAG: alcohol dehydrogenase [Thermoplasmata archaeon]|nr:MAG: alcohol dehydrogenase [Thermoplasmata archaeon]
MEFKEKRVLISGATGGMGYEIAKLLSKEDCKLALFARRGDRLKEIADELTYDKTRCIYKKCDVSKRDDIRDAVSFMVKEFGGIDAAILTAGVLIPNPIQTFDSSIIKKSIEINFMGIVYFIEYILPIMKKQRSGMIAAISTLPDKRGVPGWGAYGASKAAVSWLMESLRAEAKQRYNISIVTIKPGSVETPMIEDYHRTGAVSARRAAEIIINGLKKEKKVIQFPLSQVLLVRIQDLLPPFAYDLIPVDVAKGEGYPEVDED